ncbi:amidase [Microcoleus sp. Pol14C6]|uniref:amidase n=1 Tax=unclassified Microcoleus TaxID=2642155 RepID=UPI002FD1FAAC
MSGFPDYQQYDGLGLAELVQAKQVTPAELLEAAIARIEAYNPVINAVIYKMYEQARMLVNHDLPEGSFKGVPFLLKDLRSMYAGVPTSSGNRLLRNISANHDSELVRRFKAAGVVILGKTNTPEFGITPYTEPKTWGVTRNPWDLDRTPGGSSGGSAAAIAAGMVPIAGAGDGGGSARIPASCCGIFGLKPSRGRIPTGPIAGELWRGFSTETVLSRSVRDSAAMLDAISGSDVGATYLSPPQVRPYLDEVTTAPGKLRIAFTTHPFLGDVVHEDCINGLQATIKLLQELGHEVVEDRPKFDGEAFALNFMRIVVGETRADIEWATKSTQRKVTAEDFELGTYCLGLLGEALSAADYAKAARQLQVEARKIGQFFAQYDVLLTPTLSQPPIPIGSLQPSSGKEFLMNLVARTNASWLLKVMKTIEPLARQVFNFTPYTAPFNVTGQPAMSVPLYWNEAGLPVGMQFVGKFGMEATLFRLAGQLEYAKPWSDRLPIIKLTNR